jgi:hypothetical protein
MIRTMHRPSFFLAAALAAAPAWAQEEKPVYRCPGNLYTDTLTAKEASDRGCKTLDGAPITIIQGPVRVPKPASGATASPGASGAGPADSRGDNRIDPAQQRARDSDRRRILESELKREEEALAVLNREFNNGQPERQGDERNYARYQERVAAMQAAITRKQADIAALKRELAKLP